MLRIKKIFSIFVIAEFLSSAFSQEAKNALLIANGDYSEIKSLSQPVPEGEDLKTALESIGFSVMFVKNANRNEMFASLREFKSKVEKEGGISFIRVTDNGSGINQNEIKTAFLRHATSKIKTREDLLSITSLGFRGEALSSIAAVSKVELITKTRDAMEATRYCIEGGKEISMDAIGAPDGTTFLVRNVFFNTPVRRKFLKSAITEGSYITDLLQQLALSRPDISFKYMLNGQTKFYTNGDGDVKAIIYRIFGREISNEMVPIHFEDSHLTIDGFLGKPILNRANRNFENYFINNRYIKSKVVAKAIEDGYQPYLMQHRYPFCVLFFTLPSDEVDVNVHPTKMEVRFSNQSLVYQWISREILGFLKNQEMIPESTIGKEVVDPQEKKVKLFAPEPFEKERKDQSLREESSYNQQDAQPITPKLEASIKVNQSLYNAKAAEVRKEQGKEPLFEETQDAFFVDERKEEEPKPTPKAVQNVSLLQKILGNDTHVSVPQPVIKAKEQIIVEKPEQLNFFDEKILTKEAKKAYKIIGQVFDTYWIIEYKDKMLLVDQHAAHEKVKYESILKRVESHEMYSQALNPPMIIGVTSKEAAALNEYHSYFAELGFEIEDFGMNAFAVRGVPYDLFGYQSKELFEEILSEILEAPLKGVPTLIREKIASMACKAAVKGNHSLSIEEAKKLIDELLELENPYNCPHGRPTIITMSKYELEKKFKRIV